MGSTVKAVVCCDKFALAWPPNPPASQFDTGLTNHNSSQHMCWTTNHLYSAMTNPFDFGMINLFDFGMTNPLDFGMTNPGAHSQQINRDSDRANSVSSVDDKQPTTTQQLLYTAHNLVALKFHTFLSESVAKCIITSWRNFQGLVLQNVTFMIHILVQQSVLVRLDLWYNPY